MTILAYIALWKRPAITRICFDGLHRLRAAAKKQGITLKVLCVVSETSMVSLCRQYKFLHCFHKNEPLGAKKNFGLEFAMRHVPGWDYMLELGSDDLVKSELLQEYLPLMERGEPYFCPTSLMFVNSQDGECRTYESDTVFGAGRMMHRTMLEQVCHSVQVIVKDTLISTEKVLNRGDRQWLRKTSADTMAQAGQVDIISGPQYKLWHEEQERRLDGYSDYALTTAGYVCRKVQTPWPMILDIKSDTNLWAFNRTAGMAASLDQALKNLSRKEVKAIEKMIDRNVRQSLCVTHTD